MATGATPATPTTTAAAVAAAAASPTGTIDYDALLRSYATMGFQATNFGLAVEEINKMLAWRLSHDAILPAENEEWREPARRAATRCTIFLSFTSNQISCGQREIIHFLVKHKLVSCIVTTAGAVEEDIMKTLRPTYVGDFYLKGRDLRLRGINRTGNLLVPNLNYVALEEWFMPVLNRMHDEQVGRGAAKGKPKVIWSPSAIVQRIGEELTDESSVWYWTARNGIPVFCPGLTDGAIGDMLYYHSYDREGFIVDIARDVRRLNNIARRAKKSGMIILGGGIAKHHTCNANLMRNGADYVVYINTAHDFDGSDSGARPDEAVSWGKIRLTASPVKIYADATLVFPLLVAQTFVKHVQRAQAAATAAGTPLDCAVAPAERADDPE